MGLVDWLRRRRSDPHESEGISMAKPIQTQIDELRGAIKVLQEGSNPNPSVSKLEHKLLQIEQSVDNLRASSSTEVEAVAADDFRELQSRFDALVRAVFGSDSIPTVD